MSIRPDSSVRRPEPQIGVTPAADERTAPPTPTTTPVADTYETAGAERLKLSGRPAAEALAAQKPMLSYGSRGRQVREMQQRLRDLGYETGPIDGIFGPKTEAAVRRFQREHGLGVDGIAGPRTWEGLGTSPGRPGGTETPAPGGVPAPAIEPGTFDGHHPAGGVNNVDPWREVRPAVTNAPGDRSAAAYAEVINQFAVGENRRYARNRQGRNETYCNIFAWDVTKAMGAEIPHYVGPDGRPLSRAEALRTPGYRELSANRTADWMQAHGPEHGWRQVSAEEAQRMANEGHPSVAIWKNPGGIGHVGVVRPGELTDRGPALAQAGGRNFNEGHVRDGFGRRQPIYWVHD